MLLRLETQHIHIEDTQAIRVALFAVAAHQLLTYADAQDGILQVADYLVQIMFPQVALRGCLSERVSRQVSEGRG